MYVKFLTHDSHPGYRMSSDCYLLYHEIWRSLYQGQELPSRRAPLPVELIRLISRMANLVILDMELVRQEEEGIRVACLDHAATSQVWFWTKPLDEKQMRQVAGVQLITESRDQGWADQPELGSRIWYDIGIIPLPLSIPQETTITMSEVKSTKPYGVFVGQCESSREEVEGTIEEVVKQDPRWRKSHGVPPAQEHEIRLAGPVITHGDPIWAHAGPSNSSVVAVRASAMFRGWINLASKGELLIWKHFEPIVGI